MNLAAAQAETGQLLEAAGSYRRFVAEPGGAPAVLVSQAEEALAEVETRLARVTIAVDGLEDEDEVWLDEQVLGHGSLGVALPVDPGAHVVTVARSGAPIGEARFEVDEGQEERVEVAATTRPAPEPDNPLVAPAPEVDGEEGSAIWSSPWLWTGIGIVVVAAILVPILVVSANASGSPHMGTLGAGSLLFQ